MFLGHSVYYVYNIIYVSYIASQLPRSQNRFPFLFLLPSYASIPCRRFLSSGRSNMSLSCNRIWLGLRDFTESSSRVSYVTYFFGSGHVALPYFRQLLAVMWDFHVARTTVISSPPPLNDHHPLLKSCSPVYRFRHYRSPAVCVALLLTSVSFASRRKSR